MQCWHGRHAALAYGLAVPGLALVGLGLPLASAWLLAANMKRLNTDVGFAEKVCGGPCTAGNCSQCMHALATSAFKDGIGPACIQLCWKEKRLQWAP